MITLVVTSPLSGAGKTAICAGIAKRRQDQGKKVGYLRPVIGVSDTNGDAVFMKEMLSLSETVESISPSFKDEQMLIDKIKSTVDSFSSGKDVMIVESQTSSITKILNARLLNVVTYAEYSALNSQLPVSVIGSFESLNSDVIINKVPVNRMDIVRKSLKSSKNIIAIIPEDRALLTFSVGDLASAIDGKIINSSDKSDNLLENFMLGAMTVDSAVPYYSLMTNKVVVVRADRPDMQGAALQTSVRALLVTGTNPVIPIIQDRAQSKNVPIIQTGLDCSTVANRIEETLVKIRFHQKNKMPRLLDLLQRNFDDVTLRHVLGL